MLLELRLPDTETSFIVSIQRYVNEVESVLPFESSTQVWKQEIYFETPIKIANGEKVRRVKRGGVYYWPPGKAMCLFYGWTQVYTPAIELGYIVDPLHRLFSVGSEAKIVVERHRPVAELMQIVEKLKSLGFEAATPLDNGNRIVVGFKEVRNVRIAFSIYVENYGIHIESEGLARFGEDAYTLNIIHRLKRRIESWSDYLRVDSTEDGWIAITATLESLDELTRAVEELAEGMRIAHYIMYA